jgi:hypothetical protein
MSSNSTNPSPASTLHRALRGRYPAAVALAAIAGAGFAFGAYTSVRPQYTSTALARLAPSIPRAMGGGEQPVPAFDSFVAGQAVIAASRPVLDAALASPELAAAGWATGDEGLRTLGQSLRVVSRKGDEILRVSVTSDDPASARAAAGAVINAYIARASQSFSDAAAQTEAVLDARRSEYQSRLAALGPGSTEPVWSEPTTPGAERRVMDPRVAVLRRYQGETEAKLASLSARLMPRHPQLIETQRTLTNVRAMLADDYDPQPSGAAADIHTATFRGPDPSEPERQDLRRKLEEIDRRLDEARQERAMIAARRVTLAAPADLPVSPSTDRRAAAAAAAGMGGFGIVFISFAFAGMRRPRAVTAADIRQTIPGAFVLPSRDEQAGEECVHELRHRLDIDAARRTAGGVYTLVGSGGVATGQVALALAGSIQRSGRRAGVVTCDHGPLFPGLAMHRLAGESVQPPRLARQIEQLRSRVERVIIDAGPIDRLDGQVLAALGDRAVLFIPRGSSMESLKHDAGLMEELGLAIAGVVLVDDGGMKISAALTGPQAMVPPAGMDDERRVAA